MLSLAVAAACFIRVKRVAHIMFETERGLMQKWEYMTITSNNDGYVYIGTDPRPVPELEFFNTLGNEGWEMVTFRPGTHPLIYFKRQKS
jgi:hypothetical protein